MAQPNDLLRTCRERTSSCLAPGECMSRRELAEAVNDWLWETTRKCYELDAHAIARYERGAVRWPGAAYRSGVRHVLGVATDAELGFWPARQEPAPTEPRPASADSVQPWELTDALTHSTISTTALDHMERAVFSYATRYPSTPPAALLTAVSGQLPRLHDALNRPQPLRTRRRAVTLLGVLSGLAGNLWLDLGREDQAAGFFDVGELAGQEAEDPDLTAWVLATRSIGPFFAGQHRHAADLLARAEDAAALRSSPRRRAWVAALQARAAAAAGDNFQSRSALERSHRHMEAVNEPPSGTEFFDAPRLDGMAGTTYLLMTDTNRAVPLLTQARDRRAPADAKGRALVTLDLAECHAVDHEPEEAARLAVQALDAVEGSLVGPIVTRARTLRSGLERCSELPAVRELYARIKELPRG